MFRGSSRAAARRARCASTRLGSAYCVSILHPGGCGFGVFPGVVSRGVLWKAGRRRGGRTTETKRQPGAGARRCSPGLRRFSSGQGVRWLSSHASNACRSRVWGNCRGAAPVVDVAAGKDAVRGSDGDALLAVHVHREEVLRDVQAVAAPPPAALRVDPIGGVLDRPRHSFCMHDHHALEAAARTVRWQRPAALTPCGAPSGCTAHPARPKAQQIRTYVGGGGWIV